MLQPFHAFGWTRTDILITSTDIDQALIPLSSHSVLGTLEGMLVHGSTSAASSPKSFQALPLLGASNGTEVLSRVQIPNAQGAYPVMRVDHEMVGTSPDAQDVHNTRYAFMWGIGQSPSS